MSLAQGRDLGMLNFLTGFQRQGRSDHDPLLAPDRMVRPQRPQGDCAEAVGPEMKGVSCQFILRPKRPEG